jgi:hypothetical protein
VSRHLLGRLLGLSFALYLPLVACGADNDIVGPTAQPPAGTNTQTDTNTQTGDDLSDADHLTSGDACVASECTVPAGSVACCTTADDVSGNHALEAGKCGVDLSAFGAPGCSQLNQPGVLDTACPEVQIPPGPPMPGCCTASGHCGAMDTYFPLGCSANPDSSTWVACGSQ